MEILTRGVGLDALTDERGTVRGLLVGVAGRDGRTLQCAAVTARAVVLATGGFGQAFATTTNPAALTGDGLALAARAGARLRDVEFVQFHPTVLWQEAAAGQCPLITEALRGAGAVLVDGAGRPVMAGRHPRGDLAPRDVVAAVMQRRMERGDGPADHLWLDATGLGRAVLERDFPTVTAACRQRGIDPACEPIPVAPGAHYACGGIEADMDGRTSVAGLFAVGEAASTGVHGANRLASNSLTEALITGRRAGDLLGRFLPRPGLPRAAASLRLPPAGPGASPAGRAALASAMSRHAGVVRDRRRPPGAAPDAGAGAAGRRRPGPGHGRGDQPAHGLGPGRRVRPGPVGEPRVPPVARRAGHLGSGGTPHGPAGGRGAAAGRRRCPGGPRGERTGASQSAPSASRERGMTLHPSVTERLLAAGLDPGDTERAVRAALDEDFRYGPDVTSAATAPPGARAVAGVVARQPGVLAGLPVAFAVLDAAGVPPDSGQALRNDGDRIVRGDEVLRITAPLRGMLGAERTLLNFVTHLSGVATTTRRWVDAVAGTGCAVRDTRKTMPGLRQLEKYAVRCGGGTNHRMGLGDAALVKDNHVAAAGGVAAAIRAVREAAPGLPLEVECDTPGPGARGPGRGRRAHPARQHGPGWPARRRGPGPAVPGGRSWRPAGGCGWRRPGRWRRPAWTSSRSAR